jgi:hypothetical protein
MATNNNGHLTDDRGNVVVDFVWGSFPLQPNDDRADANLLDYTLDSHIIADSGWGGYPLFTANSAGSDVAGPTDYITVPNVLGKTTADAIDALTDAGFTTAASVSTVTTAAAATNAAKQPTRINVTTTTAATVYVVSGTGAYPVGTKVTIAAGTGIPAAVVGTWTVTGGNGTTIIISGTGWTVADSGSITPGTRLTGTVGTIKTQSIAGNASSIAPGTAITITPWAAAS